MSISSAVIEQIRQQASIEDVVSQVVSLSSSGRTGVLKGLCPFHQEDTPSFTVNINKNLYYCFGCQAGGDIFNFVQKTRAMSFVEAVRELADDCGIALKEQSPAEVAKGKKINSLYDVCQMAAEYFHRELELSSQGKSAKQYLLDRGLTEASIQDFGLGYAPSSSDAFLSYMYRQKVERKLLVDAGLARYRDPSAPGRGVYSMFRNRIMIPIHNGRGKIVAFGGRKMPGDEKAKGKYVNSPETEIYKKSQVLYGLSFARSSIQTKRRVIIVEGYFDVIALHMNGFREAIASCGTALTPEHVKILHPLTQRAIAMFDMDEAGVRAAEKSLPIFWKAGIEPLRLSLGDAKDPDEYFLEHSAEDFENLLKHVEPLFLTKLNNLWEQTGYSPGAIQQVVEELTPILKEMPPIARDASIRLMASRFGVQEQTIRSQISMKDKSKQLRAPSRNLFPKKLSDLLWYLIHYPDLTQEYLSEIDPSIFSEDIREPQLLFTMAMLMQGRSLDEILPELSSEHFRSLLLQLAVEEGLYSDDEEKIALGIQGLIWRYQSQQLTQNRRALQSEIVQVGAKGDMTQLIAKMTELQNLQKEIENLQKKIQGIKDTEEVL